MAELFISEAEWCMCDKICGFLEHRAVATEFVSRKLCMTLSAVERVAEKIKTKSLVNEREVCQSSAGLAGVLDSRFCIQIMREGALLRKIACNTGDSHQYLNRRASGSAVDGKDFDVHGEERSEEFWENAGDGVTGRIEMIAKADGDQWSLSARATSDD